MAFDKKLDYVGVGVSARLGEEVPGATEHLVMAPDICTAVPVPSGWYTVPVPSGWYTVPVPSGWYTTTYTFPYTITLRTIPPRIVEDEANRHITVWGEHKRRYWKYLYSIGMSDPHVVKSDANPRPRRAFQTHTFKSIAKTIKIPLNREVRKEKLSTSRHYRRAVAAFMRG